MHYFDDNGDGAVTATVRYYIHGELELETSKVLQRDEVWSAGIVRWPDGVIVDEGDTVETAPRRTCK